MDTDNFDDLEREEIQRDLDENTQEAPVLGIKIKSNGPTPRDATVMLAGHDISGMVKRCVVIMDVGEVNTALVTLICRDVEIDAEGAILAEAYPRVLDGEQNFVVHGVTVKEASDAEGNNSQGA